MKFTKFEKISMKNHPELSEKWVQEKIAEEPGILGLGDIILIDKEKSQPNAGRLDLLLQDAELNHRYEVEIQLGSIDESHIIRTIEYWDIERKRYPQYDHTAVIVAEDITSRFLNIVSLFNGVIPLMAIQMSALKVEDQVGLFFTTVLNRMSLGLVGEDEEAHEVTDRAYWENKATKKTVEMADEFLEIIKQFDNSLELKYNKFYIGLAKNSQPRGFIRMRPKKKFIWLTFRLKNLTSAAEKLEEAGLDVVYDTNEEWCKIRLKPGEIEEHKNILTEVMKEAHDVNTK